MAVRAITFRRLHDRGCFVLPNAWDAGSARYLQQLGFPAVATTSGGLAFSKGLPDGEASIDLDAMLSHLAEIVGALDVPVNADFQSGYARDPDPLAQNVRLCIETGAAGLSIEDRSGVPDEPLYDLRLAAARIETARAVIDQSGSGVVLTARAESFTVGVSAPLDESVTRLRAYSKAGADVLFAPGVKDLPSIGTIVEAVAPKPVNVLIGTNVGFGVSELEKIGVRRVSVGSALARVGWAAFDQAIRVLHDGSFAGLETAMPSTQLNDLFANPGRDA